MKNIQEWKETANVLINILTEKVDQMNAGGLGTDIDGNIIVIKKNGDLLNDKFWIYCHS